MGIFSEQDFYKSVVWNRFNYKATEIPLTKFFEFWITIWRSRLAVGEAKGSNSDWRPHLGRLKLGERNPNQDAVTAAGSISGAATKWNIAWVFWQGTLLILENKLYSPVPVLEFF